MRYRIYSTATWDWDVDELLETYPCLNEFSLEIATEDGAQFAYVVLNSIEELMKLVRAVNNSIIINSYPDGDMSIEVYDDWRE